MIIKSMSRKSPSYGQLVRYIEAGNADDRERIHHNLFDRESERIIAAFKENSAWTSPDLVESVLLHRCHLGLEA